MLNVSKTFSYPRRPIHLASCKMLNVYLCSTYANQSIQSTFFTGEIKILGSNGEKYMGKEEFWIVLRETKLMS